MKDKYYYIDIYNEVQETTAKDNDKVNVTELKKNKNLFETKTEAQEFLIARMAFYRLLSLKADLTKYAYRKHEHYIIVDNSDWCTGEPDYSPKDVGFVEKNSGFILWDYETCCKACDLLNSGKYIIDYHYLKYFKEMKNNEDV